MKSIVFKVIIGLVLSLNVNAETIDMNASFEEAMEFMDNNVKKLYEINDFFDERTNIPEEELEQMILATVDQQTGYVGDVFPMIERIEINNKIEIYLAELGILNEFSKNKAAKQKNAICNIEAANEIGAALVSAKDAYQQLKARASNNLPLKEEIMLYLSYNGFFLELTLLSEIHLIFMACATGRMFK